MWEHFPMDEIPKTLVLSSKKQLPHSYRLCIYRCPSSNPAHTLNATKTVGPDP